MPSSSVRIELLPGVAPSQARATIQERIERAASIGSAMGDAVALREAFVRWAEDTESHLWHLTLEQETITMLDTPRYRRILELDAGSPRPWPMINAEVELQTRALQQLAEDLDERIARAAVAPGSLAVLDTNVLLHFQPPDQVSWSEILKEPQVRLVLPLRVVEELDAKKYSRRDDLSGNARGVLRRLGGLLGSGGAPVEIRPDTTIEVFATPAPRSRPADADEEILQTCVELGRFSGSAAHLVTADIAMRIRAEAQGIAVRTMPESLERRRRPESDQTNAAASVDAAEG